jgi:predicted TIM-barrel fold metal-dependent hydrolase
MVGDQCILYASDYPHPDSKWLHTVALIQAADLPVAAKAQILGEIATQLYLGCGPRRLTLKF